MLIKDYTVKPCSISGMTVEGTFSISNPSEVERFTDIVRNAHINFCCPTINLKNVCNFGIKKVIFNNPATIVYWEDGTKTVVKCGKDDTYSEEAGLALCFMKKALGNKGNYNNTFKKYMKENKDGKTKEV